MTLTYLNSNILYISEHVQLFPSNPIRENKDIKRKEEEEECSVIQDVHKPLQFG